MLLGLLLFMACTDVPATNPYDPATPIDQQRSGTLLGRVGLPAGFEAGRLRGGGATLRDAARPAEVARTAALDADGAFLFEGVPGGTWLVDAAVPGFAADTIVAVVGIGGRTDVGLLALRANEDAVIEGRALLAGAEAAGHGGILAEALGTPYAALTTSDGAFRLRVAAGTYDLRLSRAGYGAASVPGVAVGPGETVSLEAPVTLTGAPGLVRGQVRLEPGFEDEDRLMTARVALLTGEGPALAQTGPAADGSFVFPDLDAADYMVLVELDGFTPERRALTLGVAESRDLGPIVLFSVLRPGTEALATHVEGQAFRDGAPDDGHGGIRVEAVGTPFVTETTSEGRYALALPGDTPHTLRWTAPGFDGRDRADVRSPPGTTLTLDPVVLLAQPGRLQGQVILPERHGNRRADTVLCLLPPAGASVSDDTARCRPPAPGDPDPALHRGAPDFDGRFLFERVAAGEYVVVALLDGFAPFWAELSIERATTTALRIELRPTEAGFVHGFARLEGRPEGPHAGIRVEAAGTPYATSTASDGAWSLELPARVEGYTLRFVAEGYGPEERPTGEVRAGDDSPVPDVLLGAMPGRIRGVVSIAPLIGGDCDPAAAEPCPAPMRCAGEGARPTCLAEFPPAIHLPRVSLALRRVDEQGVAEAAPTAVGAPDPALDGFFVFDGLPAGTWRLDATLEGFRPQQVFLEVPRGGLAVAPPLTLRSELDYDDARPSYLQGRALLPCEAAPCDHSGVIVETAAAPFVAVTGSDGSFRLAVSAGSYQLRYGRRGYAPLLQGPVTVGEAQVVPVDDVALVPLPAAVRGRVLRLDADGRGHDALGATVTLLRAGLPVAAVPADGEGGFLLEGGEGPHTLRAELDGHVAAAAPVSLVAGETIDAAPLVLDLTRGVLSGAFEPGDPRRSGPLTVLLSGEPGDPRTGGATRALTLPQPGPFRFEGLPAGGWRLEAVIPGHLPLDPTWRGEVRAGEETRVEGRLAPRRLGLSAPAWVAGPVPVSLERDPDVTAALIWWDTALPPDDLGLVDLPPAGPLAVEAPAPGPHVLHVRLANDLFRQAPGDPFAWLSETLLTTVTVDTTPPVLLVEPPGEWVRDRALSLRVSCSDDLAPAGALRLDASTDDGARYAGPNQPLVPLALSDAEGPRRLDVICTDAAGNVTRAAPMAFTVDLSPPVVRAFELNGGDPNEWTRSPAVTVRLDVDDTLSGAAAVALSEDPALDCRLATYAWPAVGRLGFTLSAGDGPRRLFLCARDQAGHVTSRTESNTLLLDTVPPARPSLTLQGGARATASRQVTALVGALEPDLVATLEGDLSGPRSGPPGALPIELSDVQGPHVVTATLADPAGNRSPAASALIDLDTAPPAEGRVIVADGQCVAHSREVPLSIQGTDADTMIFWTVPVAAGAPTCVPGPEGALGQADEPGCGARACGDRTAVPFAVAATFPLDGEEGPKALCWRFCDDAGNGSRPAGRRFALGAHVPRPRPVLDDVSPGSHLAQSRAAGDPPYTIHASGVGLAADTRLVVGDHVLDCEADAVPGNLAACRAEPDGSCGPGSACRTNCAAGCTAILNDDIMEHSGTYVVRLETPAPVSGALGTSAEVAFFSVVAPVPQVVLTWPRGLRQAVDALNRPIARDAVVDLWGCHLMANAQIRLGANYGEICEDDAGLCGTPAPEHLAFLDDALPALCDGRPGRHLRVVVSTAGLAPDDLADLALVAINPPPGGGERGRAFGLHPEPTRCDNVGGCMSNLRATRVEAGPERASVQGYRFDLPFIAGGLLADGATGAELRDADGAVVSRVFSVSRNPLVPLPFLLPPDELRLEDAERSGAVVRFRPVTSRGSGRFDNGFFTSAPNAGGTAVATGDVDGDGRMDAVVATGAGLALCRGSGAGPFARCDGVGLLPAGGGAGDVALADLNGDGRLDLAAALSATDRVAYRLNRGDGTFGDTYLLDGGHAEGAQSLVAADFDRDGTVDVAWQTSADVSVWLGHGDGTFRPRYGPAAGPRICAGGGPRNLITADLDGDGLLDLASSCRFRNEIGVLFGQGEGRFGDALALPTGDSGAPLFVAAADLDGDGAPDLVSANHGGDDVSVLLSAGARRWAAPVRFAAHDGPYGLEIEDLDGDGYLDLAVVNQRSNDVSVLIGNGAGVFAAPAHIPAGTSPYAFGLADFDGDALPDLVTTDSGANVGLTVRLATPGRTLGDTRRIMLGAAAIAMDVEDLNGDGVEDLALVESDAGRVSVRLGQLDGEYGAPVQLDTLQGETPPRVKWVQANNQAARNPPDLLAVVPGEASVGIWLGNADGTLAARRDFTVGNGVADAAMGLLNAGAYPDLVTADTDDDTISVRLGSTLSFGFGSRTTYPTPDMPSAVALVDLDGNNTLDLVSASLSDRVSVRPGNGSGGFGARADHALPVDFLPDRLVLGDLDGDRRADVLVSSAETDEVAWFRGRGDGTLQPVVLLPMAGGATGLELVDLDRDGLPELVAASGRTVHVWSPEPGGVLGERRDVAFDDGIRALGVGDTNGDGALDLVTGQGLTRRVVTRLLPAPRAWGQVFRELAPEGALLGPGAAPLRVAQGKQFIDRLGVRVRLLGAGGAVLPQVRLTLTAPDGRTATLDTGAAWAGRTLGQAWYPKTAPVEPLDRLYGWQPAGDWLLGVQVPAGQVVRVADFAVITHGWQTR